MLYLVRALNELFEDVSNWASKKGNVKNAEGGWDGGIRLRGMVVPLGLRSDPYRASPDCGRSSTSRCMTGAYITQGTAGFARSHGSAFHGFLARGRKQRRLPVTRLRVSWAGAAKENRSPNSAGDVAQERGYKQPNGYPKIGRGTGHVHRNVGAKSYIKSIEDSLVTVLCSTKRVQRARN